MLNPKGPKMLKFQTHSREGGSNPGPFFPKFPKLKNQTRSGKIFAGWGGKGVESMLQHRDSIKYIINSNFQRKRKIYQKNN